MSLSYCDAGRCCHRARHLPGSSSPQLMGRETTISDSSCGHCFCRVSQSLGEDTRSLAVQGACCGPGCGFGKGCTAPSRGQARSEPRLRQDCRLLRLGVSTSPGDARCQAAARLSDHPWVPEESPGDALCGRRALTGGALTVPGRQEHPRTTGSNPEPSGSAASGTPRRRWQQGLPGPSPPERCIGGRAPRPGTGTGPPPPRSPCYRRAAQQRGEGSRRREHVGSNKATLAP